MNRKDRRAADRQTGTSPPGDVERLIAAALHAHRTGRLIDAEQCYHRVLSLDGDNVLALHHLGIIGLQTGRPKYAVEKIGKAIARDRANAELRYNMAIACEACGLTSDAIANYNEAIRLKPDYVEALTNLGNALQGAGQLAEAANCYERALVFKPGHADLHYNLGNVLSQQRRDELAAAAFERALAHNSELIDAYNGLGVALIALGRYDEAAGALEHALSRNPNLAEAQMNLGNVFKLRGNLEQAAACYRQALRIRPDLAEAHNNLGLLLAAQGHFVAAGEHYSRAIAIKPAFTDAYDNLARVLLSEQQFAPALEVLQQALSIRESQQTRQLLVKCLRETASLPPSDGMAELVLRALSESWGRPNELATTVGKLIKQEPTLGALIRRANEVWPQPIAAEQLFAPHGLGVIAGNKLLMTLLTSAHAADLELERFLTLARRVLLDLAIAAPAVEIDADAIAFGCALARQCFINDYVFACAVEEADCAAQLGADVASAFERGEATTALQIAVLAAYGPLRALPCAARMRERSWPPPLDALIVQQLAEPEAERKLTGSIPRLTAIEDAVSQKVRAQYEENPYPRWVKAPQTITSVGINEYLRSNFPFARFQNLSAAALDVLIAGCGTGQNPIEIAQRFVGARVLAVDLSLASLAYAKRKTDELGLDNIEYAQADILQLAGLDRSFDLIEVAGVLHHLADQWAGWRALISRLRPGGVMRVALYSALARTEIAAVREFIAARGYQPTANDIRRCRQELIGYPDGTPQHTVSQSLDFHSISECRDLLFHVQEHRLTLPQIAEFIVENKLTLLGFEIEPWVARHYAAAYPQDLAMTDLGNWHAFETDNPHTFVRMYLFWVQKT
jgi:tetratricopeptide (TPR) repeat protein